MGNWVGLCHRRREKYNSRGYRFLMFTGISAGNLSLYPRGGSFPRFRGFIRVFSFPVPARRLFSALPRVYSREIFPCTRAVALFRVSAGISAGILPLYPRGNSFPRFRGFIRAFSFPVPARWLFSTLPRVYSRVFFPYTRAAALFRVSAGLFARFLSLYPRGNSFPRFRGFIRRKSFPVPARWLFSALPRVYSRVFFPCTRAAALFRASAGLFAGILPLYPRGGSFPRFRGYIRGKSFPVPARWLFSALPRVYPRVFFPCTRAAALFRVSAGLSAGNLSLYPRGNSFPRFRGFIRAFSSPVPARRLFISLPQIPLLQLFLNLPVSG